MPLNIAAASHYLCVMKNILIAFALLGALIASPLAAQDFTLGSLKIVQPWARATVTPTGGAYLAIDNQGAADRLVKVETGIAKAELHNHIMDGGVMKMRAVDAIPVPAGRTALSPGGYHIMLIGLKAPLKEGTTFALK